MKNLAQAVIQVMQEVKGMEKNSKVGSGRNTYNGTKDQDVKEVFNEALANNGLCIFPTDIQEDTQIEYNGNVQTKQSVFTKVKTKYLLLHTSGESVELSGYGHGVDPQDKGAGKATTYALKNTLLYTFLTPVGKIDDSETEHSQDKPVPAAKSKKPEISVDKWSAYFDKVKNAEDVKKSKQYLKDNFSLTAEQEKQLYTL